MSCAEFREAAVACLEGLLPDAARARIEEHLLACPACKAEAHELARLRERLLRDGSRARQVPMAGSVMERIRLEEEIRCAGRVPRNEIPARVAPSAKMAAAACLVVAILGAICLILVGPPWREDRGGPSPGPTVATVQTREDTKSASPKDAEVSKVPANGRTIRGRIVEREAGGAQDSEKPWGKMVPVAGAAVRLIHDPTKPLEASAALPSPRITDADGRFEIGGIPAGAAAILEVDAPPRGILAAAIPQEDDGSPLELGQVALEPGSDLEIHLSRLDGSSIEDGRVSVRRVARSQFSPPASPDMEKQGRYAKALGGGKYILERLPPGTFKLEASSPSDITDSLHVEMPRAEPLHLILAPGLGVAGRVTTASREPVVGAEVTAFNEGAIEPLAVTKTDSAGRFSTERRMVEQGTCSVSAEAPGFVRWIRGGVPAGTADLEISLVEGAAVSGKVLDPDGRALDLSKVFLGDTSTETSRGGSFEFRSVAAETYALHATHPEFAGSSAILLEVARGTRVTDQMLRMKRGIQVTGMVVDAATGGPIHRAEVTFQGFDLRWKEDPRNRRTATTDAGGAFTVSGLRKGTYIVACAAKGYLPSETKRVSVSAVPDALRLSLERGGSVTGRVLTPAGEPLPGASVKLRPSILPADPDKAPVWETMRAFFKISVRADSEGRYALEGRPPFPDCTVVATHPDLATAEAASVQLSAGVTVQGVDLKLGPGGAIHGRVVPRGGDLPQDLGVHARWVARNLTERKEFLRMASGDRAAFKTYWSSPGVQEWSIRMYFSDPAWVPVCEGGIFTLAHLAPGIYEILVGGAKQDGVQVAEGRITEGVEIVVDVKGEPPRRGDRAPTPERPEPRIVGRIRAEGEDAFPDFLVEAVARGGNGFRETSKDIAGRFEIRLPPGDYVVRATVPGYASAESAEVTVGEGERKEVLFDLMKGGKVQGIVVARSSGKAIPEAEVTTAGQWTKADASGGFILEHLPEGEIEISACHREYSQTAARVNIREGEIQRVTIQMDPAGIIAGTLTRKGRPVASARVRATRAGQEAAGRWGWPEQDGRFEIAGLPPGEYEVLVSEALGFPEKKIAVVVAGQVAKVDFEGQPLPRLTCRMTVNGAPHVGASVCAADILKGWESHKVRLDGSGEFSVELPGPGRYFLSTTPGKALGAVLVPVDVPESVEDFRQEIELSSRGISGTVVDGATSAPIPMAVALACPAGADPLDSLLRVQSGAEADGEGRFVLPFLRPGTYSIHISAAGHGSTRVDGVEVVAGMSPAEVRATLWPGARLRLRVLDPGGKPAPGAIAILQDPTGAPILLGLHLWFASNDEGLLETDQMRPGECRATVLARGFAPTSVDILVGSQGAEATISLKTCGKASIHVVDSEGRPVEGAEVTVLDERGQDARMLTSLLDLSGARQRAKDDPGSVVLDTLAPGTYRAVARKGGSGSKEETFVVAEAQATEVRLVIAGHND